MKIRIDNPEKLYFTSDTHFGHRSILSHADRPFSNLQEHDNQLVKFWNETVPKDGIVVHQGDFAMGLKSTKLKWILESLNYETIYLVQGNHEKDIMKKYWAKQYFEKIAQRIEFEVEDENGNFKSKDRSSEMLRILNAEEQILSVNLFFDENDADASF